MNRLIVGGPQYGALVVGQAWRYVNPVDTVIVYERSVVHAVHLEISQCMRKRPDAGLEV